MRIHWNRAFTLLELLISIALLGILALLAVVALNPFEQVKKGTDTVRRSVANDVFTALNNVYIKNGNFTWGTDIIAAPLSSTQGETAIASLISGGELTSGFRQLAQKDLSKVFLTSTVDGSVLRVCFLPESSSMRKDANTRYDESGNPVAECPALGCFTCIGNGNDAKVGALADAEVTVGTGGGGGSGITPTSVSIVPTLVPTATPTPTIAPTPTLTATPTLIPTPTPTPIPLGAPITKKIYLVVFNPHFSALFGNQTHIQYYGHNDPNVLTNQAIDWFQALTNGRIRYVVTKQVELNAYPTLTDGFTYDESSYNSMITGATSVHQPVWADYTKIITTTQACEAFNSGEIDEVWMFGGSWFGFYESRLAGMGSFWYNSPAITTGTTCTKPMPIMGYNFERGLPEMIHDFGHRMEYTMMKVYKSWARTRIYTNFDRFALVKAQATSFDYSGCGTTHFPPNAPADYDYSNMAPVSSMCNDFFGYPFLTPLADVSKEIVDCRTWNCNDLDFYGYWLGHLPKLSGIGPDGKLNDWWDYMLNPFHAL